MYVRQLLLVLVGQFAGMQIEAVATPFNESITHP
jgi:hypothetical protein